MHIYFAIPSYRGPQCVPFIDALEATIKLCKERGITYTLGLLTGCCYVQVARNDLVKSFRETDADVMFWLDDDVSWNPEDLLRVAEMSDEVVAGVYPYKSEPENYPVIINTNANGIATVRPDGCISASRVATGFLMVKRTAIERLCESYPSQKYYKMVDGERKDGYYDLFPQGLRDGCWVGEDYAFCRLWEDIGGAIWVVPDLNLSHHGEKEFKGNYHEFLLRQPGGSKANG